MRVCQHHYCESMSLLVLWEYVIISIVRVCYYHYCESMSVSVLWEYVSITTVRVCHYHYCESMLLSLLWEYVSISIVRVCQYHYCESMSASLLWEYVIIKTPFFIFAITFKRTDFLTPTLRKFSLNLLRNELKHILGPKICLLVMLYGSFHRGGENLNFTKSS